jgi:hypothetical protein
MKRIYGIGRQVFQHGILVATVVQEVLMRLPKLQSSL